MRICIIAALLAIGCGSSKDAPSGQPAARPTVTDPIGFCARARAVLVRRKKCFSEDMSLKMALDEIDQLVQSAPAEPEPRRKVALKCAVMLEGMMRVEQPHDCPLDVIDSERDELAAFLAAERPTPADAGIDAATP